MDYSVRLNVNGFPATVHVGATTTLLQVLREQLGLTGTKCGCNTGDCGACTVLIDGEPRRSCLALAVALEGSEVTTIEGVARGARLHPLQKAFHELGATQCGFCTPGMIMSAKALLDKNPRPTRDAIIEAISGNLCRCTGYEKIVQAVAGAANGDFGEVSRAPEGGE